jgi:F-type H+-transporting ATPase subunit b
VFGKLILILAAVALIPGEAIASGGLQHAEEWVLRRDGAWIFNFLFLFGGLYWLFIRFAIPALKHRTVDIQNTITAAETLKENAAKVLKDIEQKSGEFDSEALRMKNDALAEGDKIRQKVIADAREVSERILEKAKSEIQAEITMAKRRLSDNTVELAMDLAGKSLAKGVGKKEHKEIVKAYLDSVKVGK